MSRTQEPFYGFSNFASCDSAWSMVANLSKNSDRMKGVRRVSDEERKFHVKNVSLKIQKLFYRYYDPTFDPKAPFIFINNSEPDSLRGVPKYINKNTINPYYESEMKIHRLKEKHRYDLQQRNREIHKNIDRVDGAVIAYLKRYDESQTIEIYEEAKKNITDQKRLKKFVEAIPLARQRFLRDVARGYE